jgi:hypothetical protein
LANRAVLSSSGLGPYSFSCSVVSSGQCIWGMPGGCALSPGSRDHRGRGVRGPASVGLPFDVVVEYVVARAESDVPNM